MIVSLVGGLIIGSALTMLFTPLSGADLRKQIKDLLGDEVEKIKNRVGEVAEQIHESRCKCGEELKTPQA